MAFSQDYSLSICMKAARGGSRVLFHDAKKWMTVRNDGYHFWGGQKQCVRGAYVAELPGRELREELEEIANFAALSLGKQRTFFLARNSPSTAQTIGL